MPNTIYKCGGLIDYADDFVVCFQYNSDAETVWNTLD